MATVSRLILIAALLALRSAPSLSQESDATATANPLNLHQWGSVTLFHGLPSDHVRAITQDADGVMWFGTDGGLAKYDGRRMQKIVHAGLPASRVRALHRDRAGTLWVGTDTGAARLAGDDFVPVGETAGMPITAIIDPEPGVIVMAGEQGVIFTCRIAADRRIEVHSIGAAESPLLQLSADRPLPLTSLAASHGSVVIGTRGRGLLTLTATGIREVLSRPRAFFIGGMAVDGSGELWFGAETSSEDSGVYRSAPMLQPQKTGTATGAVTSLNAAGDLMWAGTWGQGAFLFRDAQQNAHLTFENTAGGLRSNDIYTVFVDREGVVWFGTDRGVCRYDPQSPQTETVSTHPEANFVRALFEARDGAQWFGTNRGLFVRRPGGVAIQAVESLGQRTVHAIAEDPSGRMLIGAAGGLFAQTAATLEFVRVEKNFNAAVPDSVRAIAQFEGAAYFATFGGGLEKYDGIRRTLIWPPDTDDTASRELVSLKAAGGRLWIGTAQGGLFEFDGSRVRADQAPSELKGTPVWDIERTSDGVLWLATERGLYTSRPETPQPVLKGDVRRIIVDEAAKSVWCATAGSGLVKILLADGAGIQSGFSTEHGLPSNSVFTILRSRSDSGGETLWLGTNRGFTQYRPGGVAPVLHVVRVLGQRAFQPAELTAGIHLEYPQNSLVLEVAGIGSRTFPEQFQYEFTLADASRTISRRASPDSQFLMQDLRPGRYRVSARAFSKDLAASEPLVFDITVPRAPFPWTSAALSILLGWSLVALVYGYRQNRRLKQSNAALADTRRQLANETENERRRIARDLHDQTLSDLRRLLLLADRIPSHGDADPALFRREIESVSTEIRHICEDLSPSVLANVGLAAALQWALADMVMHLPPERRFQYEFRCPGNVEERLTFSPSVDIQIYRIAQEAISNVCRHSGATQVRLTVAIAGSDFVMTLEDNGRGFDWTGKPATGRGLTGIRSRASLIEAEAQWAKRPSGGSIFTLRRSVQPSMPQSSG